jgi:hypothetical protein
VRQLSGRRIQAQGMTTHELPLRRYFLFVGGGLLALLFLLDAVLPPPARESSASGLNLPVIRIHSELKRPSAMVIDTSQRMIAPLIAAQDDSPAAPAPSVIPDSRIRESFAQLVLLSNRQMSASEPKKPERHPLPKRKVVLAHVKHPTISYHQASEFRDQLVNREKNNESVFHDH